MTCTVFLRLGPFLRSTVNALTVVVACFLFR
jgi:hypothetical protein